jgi:hypothetical protein
MTPVASGVGFPKSDVIIGVAVLGFDPAMYMRS